MSFYVFECCLCLWLERKLLRCLVPLLFLHAARPNKKTTRVACSKLSSLHALVGSAKHHCQQVQVSSCRSYYNGPAWPPRRSIDHEFSFDWRDLICRGHPSSPDPGERHLLKKHANGRTDDTFQITRVCSNNNNENDSIFHKIKLISLHLLCYIDRKEALRMEFNW